MHIYSVLQINLAEKFRAFIPAISLCFIFYIPVRSQDTRMNSDLPEAEKIYLQLDGKVYTTDNTIWFKSIVTNAGDHTPSKLSGVLYAELIGPDEKIIEKKLIKLENGIGTGFFDLNQSYREGTYLIRAYTEWDRNFSSDFFFNEYIQVFAPGAKMKTEPINNVSLVEKDINKRHLVANFDPAAIDTLHKKELTVIITTDNNTDTLFIEKTGAGKYLIDFDIPDSCQFVTLKMITKNKFSFTKTLVLDEDHLDLQFFPESGELVNGIGSRVGYKALEYNGKGKSISGDIIDGKGDLLTRFKSNELGMGSFILNSPDKDRTYFARIKSQSDSTLSNIYPLPKVAPQGNVLSVVRNLNEFQLTASSGYMKNDSIYIKVTCRGFIYYVVRGKLKDGMLEFSLPVTNLPDGIIAFTLIDPAGQPVAERLAFNKRAESRLNIEISSDKDSYTQRELTWLKIETTDYNSKPVAASLSLLVLNKEQMGKLQDSRQNILSYFLIRSDLKGEIENPGFYFSKNCCYDDLDALMLTQGWRKYLYNNPVKTFSFERESTLNLSGSVGGSFATRKNKKGAEITMMTFGHRKTVKTQTTDSLGRFYFSLNDEYGQNVNILIQSANRAGIKKDYTINLDKKESPEVSFNHISSVGKVDTIVKRLVEKNIVRKTVEESYKLSKGILLGEVKVEAYRMTPARQKVMQEYGKPKEVISGETIREKEEKWSYGLYSVIQSKFPQIRILRYGFELIAEIRKSAPTLVIVDGKTVDIDNFGMVGYMPASEVSSFEILEDVSNKGKIWDEFWSPYKAPPSPKTIDVISIYTYGEGGFFGVRKTTGIFKGTVAVFSTPREFYSPKYENLKPEDWYKPDLRALIDWEPKLVADSLGIASASFYNSDNTGKVEVVVEAISEKGEVGYKEMVYDVKKSPASK